MKNYKRYFKSWPANERGDTFVSVLISLVVIGIILVLAWIMVDRSYDLNLRARERNQITKVVQSQIESLKSIVIQEGSTAPVFSNTTVYQPGAKFCLDVHNNYITTPAQPADPSTETEADKTTRLAKQAQCAGVDELYGLEHAEVYVYIQYTEDEDCGTTVSGYPDCEDTGDEDLFTVTAEWQRWGGWRKRHYYGLFKTASS